MLAKIKIAIADNNRELCQYFSELVSLQEDMELAAVAYNGIEALQVIEEKQPDVLILDITMPYLDGIGVLEKFTEFKKKPMIIILTAFEQEAMIQRLIGLGATYYMVKPFEPAIVFERIRQFFLGSSKVNTSVPIPKEKEESYESLKKVSEKSANHLEFEVSKLFHEMGIPAHFRGYAYLRDAIIIAAQELEVLGNITKNLYPRIAEKYNSTPSGVESAIRHTIEISWERGNADYMEQFFGCDNQRNRFPTSASFIARIADKLRLECINT